jgi:hypothetical protein
MSDDDQDQGPDFEGTIKKVVGSLAGRFRGSRRHRCRVHNPGCARPSRFRCAAEDRKKGGQDNLVSDLKRFRETARQNREQERLRSDRDAAKVALRQELQDQRIKEADDDDVLSY